MASIFQHTSAARGEVLRRQQEYKNSLAPTGTDYYKAKTRKNAYVSVTAGPKLDKKKITRTLPASKNTYDTLYANSEGKPDVVLNSVKISERGEFGMLRQVDIQFTCLRRSIFEEYERAFLVPKNKLTVSYGYVDGSQAVTVQDYIICKYGFSIDVNNQYVCNLRAYGPSPFMNETELAILPGRFKDKNFKAPGWEGTQAVATLPQYLKYKAQGDGTSANVDIPTGTIQDKKILILDNPNGMTPESYFAKKVYKVLQKMGMFGSDSSKLVYCTLEWFIETLNTYYLGDNLTGDMKGRKLVCNTKVTNGEYLSPICSAYPMSIVLTGNEHGYYGSSTYVGDGELKIDFSKHVDDSGIGSVISSDPDVGADYSKILLSYDYISSKLFGVGAEEGKIPDKSSTDINESPAPGLSLKTVLDTLFADIAGATGGYVILATMEGKDDEQWVIAKNGKTSDIKETIFKPLNGDGITRESTVKCDVPANAAYAVASGQAGVSNAKTPHSLSEEDPDEKEVKTAEEKVVEAKGIIKEHREVILSMNDFDSEDCKALETALRTVVESASEKDTAKKISIDQKMWPLELSIKLDGIHGFRFGDVINSDFMPSRYHKEGVSVSFVVLEVNHTISDNDWVTELKSQCHLIDKSAQ